MTGAHLCSVVAKEQLRARQETCSTSDRYVVLETIGSGGCGIVYKAYDSLLHKYVAVKTSCTAKSQGLSVESQLLTTIANKDIDKDFMVLPMGSFCSEGRTWLVFELMLADLWDEMENYRMEGKAIPVDLVRHAGYCVLRALSSLHDHSLVHGDVKLDNMLLSKNFMVKLGDFGCLHYNHEPARSVTLEYGAPEQLKDKRFAMPASDVWSWAVALVTLVTFELPFTGSSPEEYLQDIESSARQEHQQIVQRLNEVDCELGSLVSACLRVDPYSRPSARQLLQHPFFDPVRHHYSEQPSPSMSTHTSLAVNTQRCSQPLTVQQPAQAPDVLQSCAPTALQSNLVNSKAGPHQRPASPDQQSKAMHCNSMQSSSNTANPCSNTLGARHAGERVNPGAWLKFDDSAKNLTQRAGLSSAHEHLDPPVQTVSSASAKHAHPCDSLPAALPRAVEIGSWLIPAEHLGDRCSAGKQQVAQQQPTCHKTSCTQDAGRLDVPEQHSRCSGESGTLWQLPVKGAPAGQQDVSQHPGTCEEASVCEGIVVGSKQEKEDGIRTDCTQVAESSRAAEATEPTQIVIELLRELSGCPADSASGIDHGMEERYGSSVLESRTTMSELAEKDILLEDVGADRLHEKPVPSQKAVKEQRRKSNTESNRKSNTESNSKSKTRLLHRAVQCVGKRLFCCFS